MLPTKPLQQIYRGMKPVTFFSMRHIPFRAQKMVVEKILNRLLKTPIEEGDLDFVTGKTISIRLLDADVTWHFRFINEKLAFHNTTENGDVIISGNSDAFLLLAANQKDPDTLFFRRLLMIEGDTELGLEVKNLLDSLEMDGLPAPLQALLKQAGEIAELSLSAG